MKIRLRFLLSCALGVGLLGATLLFPGCKLPTPPASTTKMATVSLEPLYLSGNGKFCSSIHEGVKPIKVTITVDLVNSNGSIQSNFKTYRYNVTNEDNDKKNTEFSNVQIPTSGTFAITVTAEATVCYKCCFSNSGCGANGGYPFYRGISTTYNSSSSPSFFRIAPRYANCF